MANITGTSGNDTLTGTSVADSLRGGSGDDLIDGSGGIDIAFVSEVAQNYRFGRSGVRFTVQHVTRTATNDGTDSLRGVERLGFSDREFGLFAEFRVNSTLAGGQSLPSSTGLSSGDYLVVWQSAGQDGSGSGIYGQRFAADGTAQGVEFQVNTTTAYDQTDPATAGLTGGGFVVVWTSEGQDGSLGGVFAQVFDSAGIAVGSEFQINSTSTDQQRAAAVVALPAGGFAVSWTSMSEDGSGEGVYLATYDSMGVALSNPTQVNTFTTGDQSAPSVAMLAGGGFLVVWQSLGQDGSGHGIYAQRYDDSGSAQGLEFRVNTKTSLSQMSPSVTGLAGGGAVVAWVSLNQDGSRTGVYAQVLDDQGVAVGSEFRINAYTLYEQQAPHVAALSSGGFIVSWESRLQDGSGFGVYARAFSSTGVAQGGDVLVNGTTLGQQTAPAIAALADGGYAVSWLSQGADSYLNGIFSSSFDASGNARGPVLLRGTINADIFDLSGTGSVQAQGLAGDDTYRVNEVGDLVMESPDSGNDLVIASFSMTIPENVEKLQLSGTANLTATGNDLSNLITGAGGNDTLDGGAGNDSLKGGLGDDTYVVTLGDSITEFLSQGTDTVYSDVSWTLATNVENLVLTGLADAVGRGNAVNNDMSGTPGNDSLLGLAGSDTLAGGGGNDTLDGGVSVDSLVGGEGDDAYIVTSGDIIVEGLDEGADSVTSSVDFTLASNVENLVLTGYAVTGAGNELDNALTANAGPDVLIGLGGDDVLHGDVGADTLSGGAGNDTIYGDDTTSIDRVIFDAALSESTNVDLLVDISSSDRILLDDDIFTAFNAAASGSLAATEFYKAAGADAARTAQQHIIYDTDTGFLYYDADGVGGAAAVLFAQIGTDTHPEMFSTSFLIIG